MPYTPTLLQHNAKSDTQPVKFIPLPRGHIYMHIVSSVQILVISTLALSKTLCPIKPPLLNPSLESDGAFKIIRAYVPAPRRLDRYPGLITSTLSTT